MGGLPDLSQISRDFVGTEPPVLLAWQDEFVSIMCKVALSYGIPEQALAIIRPQMVDTVLKMELEEARFSLNAMIEQAYRILSLMPPVPLADGPKEETEYSVINTPEGLYSSGPHDHNAEVTQHAKFVDGVAIFDLEKVDDYPGS